VLLFEENTLIRISSYMSIAVPSLSWTFASVQTIQTSPAAPSTQTIPDLQVPGNGEEGESDRRPTLEDNNSTSNQPALKDETVSLGSSLDRAPRDIKEPFDE
jgi:hypothetical protein